MGVIFAIALFAVFLMIGFIGIIAGVIGLIIGCKRRKNGKSLSKAFTVVFAIVLTFGIIITLIPVGFFSFIVLVNSVPPDGFVETEIVIEENGYQDTRFTADGVVYEVLDFEVYDSDAIANPIFTYKTDGFLNGSQCGNYYAIENGQGFRLVSDEFGQLFCPREERESVISYYSNMSNLGGYYDDRNECEFKLTDKEIEAVQDLLKVDLDLLRRERTVLENAEVFEIKLVCKEGLVYVNSYVFLILNEELYYVYGSDFADGNGIEYTLIELPSEIADALLAIHKTADRKA